MAGPVTETLSLWGRKDPLHKGSQLVISPSSQGHPEEKSISKLCLPSTENG